MKTLQMAGTCILMLGLQGSGGAAEPPQAAATEPKLVTRVFSVPPDFSAGGSEKESKDPLVVPEVYPAVPGKSYVLSRSGTAGWPVGAGVVIDRQTHQMVIRNTETNMKLIESLVSGWNADWQKRRAAAVPIIFYDEMTFSVSGRRQAGHLLEAVYVLPTNFTTTDLTETLKQQGIPLPDGASTRWDPAKREATVRTTSANLDLVFSWFAALWEDSGETPPFQSRAPSPVLLEQGQVDQAMRDLASKKLPPGL